MLINKNNLSILTEKDVVWNEKPKSQRSSLEVTLVQRYDQFNGVLISTDTYRFFNCFQVSKNIKISWR